MSARSYVKGDPSLDILPQQPKSTNVEPSSTSPSVVKDTPFQKKESFDTPKSFIVVLSGGTIREKNYFKLLLTNSNKFPNLKFEFLAEDRFNSNMEPRVFGLAEDRVNYYKSSESPEKPDKYFVVTDVDLFEQHLIPFQKKCLDLGIKLIISNPCIEVWLYYSKRDDKFYGFTPPSEIEKISQAVKTFVSTQIPGGVNPIKALFDIETNIINARKNFAKDDNGIPMLFSTNMFVLAETLLPVIKDGLEILKQNIEQKKEMMLKKRSKE